jgi:hypothetical protein
MHLIILKDKRISFLKNLYKTLKKYQIISKYGYLVYDVMRLYSFCYTKIAQEIATNN